MWEFYLLIAPDIRMICYAIIGGITILQAAKNWVNRTLIVSVIHMLTGLFMLSSFHFAWTRNLLIAVYFTTPLVLIWAIMCLWYTVRIR